MRNEVHLADCMNSGNGLPSYADNYFDLAICDPPYGIGETWEKDYYKRKIIYKETSYKNDEAPRKEYFDQILRVSKSCIIWGYNYFADKLPLSNNLIIWDKKRNVETTFMSEAEIAWTNINVPMRIVQII